MNTDFAESDLNTNSKQEQEFSGIFSCVQHGETFQVLLQARDTDDSTRLQTSAAVNKEGGKGADVNRSY